MRGIGQTRLDVFVRSSRVTCRDALRACGACACAVRGWAGAHVWVRPCLCARVRARVRGFVRVGGWTNACVRARVRACDRRQLPSWCGQAHARVGARAAVGSDDAGRQPRRARMTSYRARAHARTHARTHAAYREGDLRRRPSRIELGALRRGDSDGITTWHGASRATAAKERGGKRTLSAGPEAVLMSRGVLWVLTRVSGFCPTAHAIDRSRPAGATGAVAIHASQTGSLTSSDAAHCRTAARGAARTS
jgi:hypothetical protein